MTTKNFTVEQLTSAQKQMLDGLADNCSQMVSSLTPENTPAREVAELALEYFNRYRSIMEPVTQIDNPQALAEAAVESLKQSSKLNLEFSHQYLDVYKRAFGQHGFSAN
jgi:hypothetical protein